MRIIITGASRGIGRAIAEAFAKEQNHLLLCARHESRLLETAREIRERFPGVVVDTFATDLSVKENVYAFADYCLQFGAPDVLVNNAGVFTPGTVLQEPEGALEAMLQCNVMSAYYLSRRIIPAMQQAKSGHIFNMASIAGLQAYENGGGYSISKFALIGMSKNLRYELRNDGVKVTTIMPGAVMTDSWEGYDNSAKRIMEAKDIADMVYACSQLSRAATVEEIIIRPQQGDL